MKSSRYLSVCYFLQNMEPNASEIQRLKEQLATLTKSLSTVTQQKSTMEASYQAEKKKLRVSII